MDDFGNILLKKKTLVKFKKYSKKTSPNYSETVDFMMAFFEDNKLSSYDTLNFSITSLNNVLNKRLDAVVSILKNAEETQLKPTREMLESLFKVSDEKPLLLERKDFFEIEPFQENKELIYYKDQYLKQQSELSIVKNKLKKILENIKPARSPFGQNGYELKLTQEQYESLKIRLGF